MNYFGLHSEEAGMREEAALPFHVDDRHGLRKETPNADYSFGGGIFFLRRSSRSSRAFRTDFTRVTSVSTTFLTCGGKAGTTINTSEALDVPEKAVSSSTVTRSPAVAS